MFLEEGVPFVTVSGLHLIVSVEALQCRSGDVDFPVEQTRGRRNTRHDESRSRCSCSDQSVLQEPVRSDI